MLYQGIMGWFKVSQPRLYLNKEMCQNLIFTKSEAHVFTTAAVSSPRFGTGGLLCPRLQFCVCLCNEQDR